MELLTKYGIDGSSSQSLFSFKYDDELHKEVCETSILPSFTCPIRPSNKTQIPDERLDIEAQLQAARASRLAEVT